MHRSLMQNRHFVMLWSAQIASNIGDSFYSISLLWYLLQQADSPSSLSLLTIPEMAAGLLFYIVFGAAADRYSPGKLMVGADAARLILVLAVFALAMADVSALGYFMAVQFGVGLFSALFYPARTVAMRRTVPPELLAQANALQDSAFRAIRIAAPMAVGAMAAFVPLHWLMLVNAASYAVSAAFIIAANRSGKHAHPADSAVAAALSGETASRPRMTIRQFSGDIAMAVKELLRKRILLYTLLFGNMGFVAWQVLWTVGFPVLANDLVSAAEGSSAAAGTGEAGGGMLGVIIGCYGVGNLIGSLVMTRLRVRVPFLYVMGGWLFLAAGYGIIAAGHNVPWLVYAGAAAAGLGGPVIGIPLTTAIQTQSDPQSTGKIFSLNMLSFTLFCIGSAGIGALGFGDLPVSTMFRCGAVFLAVMVAIATILYAKEPER
jgi:DHA3 family macrolide efflux protein-like MFS transporter